MLQLSNKYGVSKFVFASSAAVYGAEGNLPLRENSSGSPISMYGMNNRDLSREVPLMSAPIMDNGVVVAVVSVHTYRFESYSLYTHNLFKVAVYLITSALSRAFRYLDATYGERRVSAIFFHKEQLYA